MFSVSILCFSQFSFPAKVQWRKSVPVRDKATPRLIEQLRKQMTLEEKAVQMAQFSQGVPTGRCNRLGCA